MRKREGYEQEEAEGMSKAEDWLDEVHVTPNSLDHEVDFPNNKLLVKNRIIAILNTLLWFLHKIFH